MNQNSGSVACTLLLAAGMIFSASGVLWAEADQASAPIQAVEKAAPEEDSKGPAEIAGDQNPAVMADELDDLDEMDQKTDAVAVELDTADEGAEEPEAADDELDEMPDDLDTSLEVEDELDEMADDLDTDPEAEDEFDETNGGPDAAAREAEEKLDVMAGEPNVAAVADQGSEAALGDSDTKMAPDQETGTASEASKDWDPFAEMDKMQVDMEKSLERTAELTTRSATGFGALYPDLDVQDQGDRYVVKMDLPGVEKEKINVEVTSATLAVSAKRQTDKNTEKEGYREADRNFGSFRRNLAFPAPVATDKVTAQHENGVLTIELEKAMPAKEDSTKVTVAVK
jgi:HSP20 family protein